MNPRDPLASATLARLYLSQGHDRRALQIITALLETDPLDGHALALRERLASRGQGELVLRHVDGELAARYRGASHQSGVHVVVAAWTTVAGTPRGEPVRSRPCPAPDGELVFPAPPGPASACACLAALDAGGALHVLAVAEPVVW
jgi:hypothetical protein